MDRFNPLQFPLCFAYPLRVAPSQWTEHVPFAMFVVEAVRPQVVVELGTHFGVSYCAFCQAIKTLRLGARAYAVDTWQGDPHTGFYGAEVLNDLRRHHDPLYCSFSRLIQSTFAEAVGHFPDGTIDLLHIDGCHTYEAVKLDFETWLPKVSERGVILFHDINVRENDFGVWRFWEEVKDRYRSFAFVHQHGLGVLAVGQTCPEALRPLVDPAGEVAVLREVFCQLGQRVSIRLQKELETQELAAQLRAKSQEIQEAWATKNRENEALWAQISSKENVIYGLNAEVADKTTALQELSEQLLERIEEVQGCWRQLGQKDEAIRHLEDQVGSLQKETRDLSALLESRDQEIQGLKGELSKRSFSRFLRLPGLVLRTVHGLARQSAPWRAQAKRAWQVWKQKGTRAMLRKIWRRLATRFASRVPAAPAKDLHVQLDRPVHRWRVGKGNVLWLSGACYHPDSRITALEVVADGNALPVKVSMMNRPDVFQAQFPDLDPQGFSRLSGFCAMVPVSECPDRTSLHLAVRARLRTGITCMRSLGDIALDRPAEGAERALPAPSTNGRPAIAICMTTHNPSPELFARQIHSIQNQTNADWICIISDDCSRPKIFEQIVRIAGSDPRFHIHQNASRLGFYHNFEQCLSLVPPEVDYVALSDHDDWWQTSKLDTLLAHFDDETTLVYSDMNIVDQDGRRIAGTYWTNRCNNYRRLGSLFLANTITGAASMFRRSLLEYLLPFPDPVGVPFHDHWIGCTALTLGRIKYIGLPLYDYVQHGGNVIGHYIPPRRLGLGTVARVLKAALPVNVRLRMQAYRARSKAIYMNDLLRIQHLAQVLLLRCAGRLPRDKAKTLRRLARLDSSLISIAWLMGRSLISLQRKTVTMGAENALLRGLGWRRIMGVITWMRSHRRGESADAPTSAFGAAESTPKLSANVLTDALERVEVIEQKIAPLSLRVSPAAPRRVNLLIPTVDFQYVFGGYITKFNLAQCLAEEGYRVRVILVDYTDYQPIRWKQQLRAYPGLEKLLDCVEIAYAFDRSQALECHSHDALIATTWWTAHIARHAVRMLGQERFVYLIQEFEPFTFAMGSFAALAEQTYGFPHYAVFSTEFLRDYFRQSRLGVFAEDREAGEQNSLSFENTITAVGRITVPDLARRSPKKLLFYARPESHAARNMFELGIAALVRAVKAGSFAGAWEFYGIGTVERGGQIPLANGLLMHLLPRQSQETYREVLRAHDLGLSLMYTPHPSLVPIEMASAGMLTVTNTWGNKTAERLKEISSNLIAVAPTVEAVQAGLKQAVDQIDDHDQRVRGARVKWSTSWDHSFNPQVMAQLKGFLEVPRETDTGTSRAA
jgi:glycosyltransferase involved in cell wall biosynthesis